MTSARLGSSRYFICPKGPVPSGHCALTGSQVRNTPKATMRKIADTNSGTAVSERPVIVIASRLARKRAMRRASVDAGPPPGRTAARRSGGSGQRRVAQIDEPLGIRVVAANALRPGAELVVEVRIDRGRVVLQEHFELLGVAPLILQRDSGDVRLRERVEPLALVVRRVPDALRVQRRREVDVRDRAAAPVGDVDRRVEPGGRTPALRR